MLKTIYSKSRRLFPIAIVAFAVAMLASCSSSNQFASSFSKRKYTPGHFSDPVAKIKTGNANAATLTTTANNNVEANTKLVTKNEKAIANANFSAPVKSTYIKKAKPEASPFKTLKQYVFGLVKAPVNNNSNLSLQQNSTIQDSPAYGDHDHGGGSGGGHHFLRLCLIFLLLWLIFIILAAVTAVGSVATGSAGGFGIAILFDIFAWVCLLLSLIFFILWLISLAN